MLPLLCLPIFSRGDNSGLMIGSTTISPSMLGLGLFIFFPLMISLMSGASFGKLDCWGKAQMSSFFATRPIATTNFVTAKIVAAAIVALLCWAIVLVVVRHLGGTRGQPSESARIADSLVAESSHAAIDRRGAAWGFRPRVFHLAKLGVGNVARAVWPQMGCEFDWIWIVGFNVRWRTCSVVDRTSSGNSSASARIRAVAVWRCLGDKIRNNRGHHRGAGASLSDSAKNGNSDIARLVCSRAGSFRRRLLLLRAKLDGGCSGARCFAAGCNCPGAIGPLLEPASVVKDGASVTRH